jgi:3-oxoacyl-(acyl-carrier-protein) synthase
MRVVVSGVGAVCGFGVGVGPLWDGLAAGAHAIKPIRAFDVRDFPVQVAGEVEADAGTAAGLRALGLGDVVARWEALGWLRDRKLGFAALAAQEAWASAGCGVAEAAACGLSLGLGLEQALLEDFLPLWTGEGLDWSRHLGAASDARVTLRTPADLSARAVRGLLGLEGMEAVNLSACAAGAMAVAQGAAWIRRGWAQRVVCGGADSMLNPLGLGGLARLGATSPRHAVDACRPFDARRDGLVMGEGAAVFVLEREDVARARGVKPWGEVLGWGTSQDGYRATAPRPDGAQAAQAMRAALRCAGLPPTAIEHVNAHGTGTPLNDPAEVLALRAALGAHAERVPVCGIKGAVGHLMAASGALELAAALMSFHHDLLPGTAHHRDRDLACDLDIIGERPRIAQVQTVISTSFGFGGQNAAVILGRYDR